MEMLGAPLCPAGHLPRKGGDYAFIDARLQSPALQNEGRASFQPISPLAGEMSGRTEGGAVSPVRPIKGGTLQCYR
ncbi:hypothetical protein GCM10011491_20970 [Brucella endophytica]|uniref:Lytic murein transglycosylase n=1 Tax=Brucella endophytica TaxID=1963359 RepID=A0A916SBS2_9HYPH|nr:hypothetical protein GCM10011491_20970 [Brucella endophytica]